METELNGYKKNIVTEQQRNEQLTMLHNKLLMDMSTVKRHIQTSVQKREQLKTEYSKVGIPIFSSFYFLYFNLICQVWL